MNTQRLTFQNDEGQTLSAGLEFPVDGKPKAYALFAHCFTCSRNLNAVRNIASELSRRGIAMLSFDFTGLGRSEGDFADTNFSSNVEDLVAAARFLEREFKGPDILIGHSLGGAAVLLAARFIHSVKAVATIGAPAEPEHVSRHFQSSVDEIRSSGKAVVSIGGREFTVKKQFIDDLEISRMEESISSLKRALAVFHSPVDETVGIENAARIFQAAKHPKSFISLDGADHLLTNKADSTYVGSTIAAWASRYAFVAEEDGLTTNDQVAVRTAEGFTTEIKTGRHYLVGDEPEAYGGNDFGPSPYGYLAIALGCCTSMTLRMYADRKNWPLLAVKVHLNHEKTHREDCENCESVAGKIDHLQRKVELIGPLTEEQRQRLLEIADKCPVHRTLHSEVVIETELL